METSFHRDKVYEEFIAWLNKEAFSPYLSMDVFFEGESGVGEGVTKELFRLVIGQIKKSKLLKGTFFVKLLTIIIKHCFLVNINNLAVSWHWA